jgi:integrase-like protein
LAPKIRVLSTGRPWQNTTDESFNGRRRDEYLTLRWFRNRIDAKVGIAQWRRHYNEESDEVSSSVTPLCSLGRACAALWTGKTARTSRSTRGRFLFGSRSAC